MDPERTLFRVGSITKLFTWTAVMQQVEEGTLDLDADVNRYLTDVQIPPAFDRPVTLTDLLTHTPGFDDVVIGLSANGSDVRLLELSLQPTGVARSAGTTAYTWDYKRLLFGQPVRLDVLGIAPIDRLGELTWLAPVSVVVFGLLVGLVVHAVGGPQFDRWMLLLTVGTFAGAYPLMYFAQEYIPLGAAVLASAGLALAILGVRAVTLMGWRLALAGVILPAAVILAVTLTAAIVPRLPGILLTAGALASFIAAMMLIPKVRIAPAAPGPAEAGPAEEGPAAATSDVP